MTTDDVGLDRPGMSMLVRFAAANARSFRDHFELNLMSTAMSDPAVVREVPWRDGGRSIGLLPAACVFGPNGSGKTNVLRAMADMRSIVMNSFAKWNPTGGTRRWPFALGHASPHKPSRYEVDIVLDGVRHEYGFELDDVAILSEWAYRYPRGRAALMFRRDGNQIEVGASLGSKGRTAVDLIRSNALFLSTAAMAGQPDLSVLFEWFRRNFILAEADTRHSRHLFTADLIGRGERQADQVRALLRAADLGITDVRRVEPDAKTKELMQRAVRILTDGMEDVDENLTIEFSGLMLAHRGADGEYELAASDESLGTMVWLGLVGPLVASLARGSVLLADEIDASLHPSLVSHIVRIFQSPETNPNRAQIIFNSHEVTLLGEAGTDRELGRDQIWFSEKGHDGATRVYPLTDLEPRKDEPVGRRWLAGRYGAVPIVSSGDFEAAAELIYAGTD